jgi:U3 small nucleolar RNA-associated protein MPP10
MGKRKEAREFIPVDAEASSDDEYLDAMLGEKRNPENGSVGLDEEYSDDGEGLYCADESVDEDAEDEEDLEEGEEGEEEDFDESDGGEEGTDTFDGEFSDGNPNELAQEGEEDSETGSEFEEEDEPVQKKQRGLGELARKLASLEEEIAEIESKQIDKKHWTLTGEVTAKARPVNSMLEANIELPFGHMAGKRLDDSRDLMVDENDFDPENPEKPRFDIDMLIRQRVADRSFDDVLRKKIETVVHEHKPEDRHEGVDFEKSQLGLAEVYAKQYEKDIFNQSEDAEKVSAEKEEARRVFAKLMHKLDCLTNFNFAPRPPTVKKPGADGVKDLPAMKLEEAIPLVISSSVRANS